MEKVPVKNTSVNLEITIIEGIMNEAKKEKRKFGNMLAILLEEALEVRKGK